ncbi:MAG: DUF5009 domain-containing protein [Bacteroidota bacterium]
MSVVTEPVAKAKSVRLVSLDAFRGATIIGMILVNNPGSWANVYAPLLHAEWHGWTPTDLVFPFFLYIVGIAIPLAFGKYLARGDSRGMLLRKTVKRSAILFGLGVFMAAFPFITFEPDFGLRPGLERLRIMGVLQRIALCYLAAAVLFLYAKPRTEWIIAAALLLGYWAAMMLIPVPGYGAGQIDIPEANLAAYLDRLVLTEAHLWAGADRMWDPEGLFSTLPAIVTTLIGVWAGRLFSADLSPVDRTAKLFVYGFAMLTAGYLWAWAFPLNKALWTSSYVLFTAGIAQCVLAVCYWFADVQGRQRWTIPLQVYGVNAITVFFFSGLVGKALYLIRIAQPDGSSPTIKGLLYDAVFVPLGPPKVASLLFALTWITVWFGVLWAMWKRGLVVKV